METYHNNSQWKLNFFYHVFSFTTTKKNSTHLNPNNNHDGGLRCNINFTFFQIYQFQAFSHSLSTSWNEMKSKHFLEIYRFSMMMMTFILFVIYRSIHHGNFSFFFFFNNKNACLCNWEIDTIYVRGKIKRQI